MEWISKNKKPEEKPKEEITKVVYANQKVIDEMYKDVFGCRYPCGVCKRNYVQRLCCRTCELYRSCRNRCLATPRECQSTWDIPRDERTLNQLYLVNGEKLTMRQMADKYGIKYNTILRRIQKGVRGNDIVRPTLQREDNKLDGNDNGNCR